MIEISVIELEPYVTLIRQINQQLTDTLVLLKNEMLMIENFWIGQTSSTFREKVSNLDQKIVYYQEFVERYATHLETIIEQYRITELNLQHNISEF